MEQRAIADTLKTQFSEEVVDIVEYQGQVGVLLRPDQIVPILRWLRDSADLRMDHLRALCGVDNSKRKTSYPERFEVVYQLYSTELRHEIRLRVLLPEKDPHVDSVVSLWSGANWLEREVFDMFGIRFNQHPNLKRVLLPDDWEGHPLRKEYPLKGRKEWQGLVELKERIQELDQHGFYLPPPVEAKKDGTAKAGAKNSVEPQKTVAQAAGPASAGKEETATVATAPPAGVDTGKTLRERDQA